MNSMTSNSRIASSMAATSVRTSSRSRIPPQWKRPPLASAIVGWLTEAPCATAARTGERDSDRTRCPTGQEQIGLAG